MIFLHQYLYFFVLKFPLFHFSAVGMKHNTLYYSRKVVSLLNKHTLYQ